MDWSGRNSVRASLDHVSLWLLMPFVQNDFWKHQNSPVLLNMPPCTSAQGRVLRGATRQMAAWRMGTQRPDCLSWSFLADTALHLSSWRSLLCLRTRNLRLATGPLTVEMRAVMSREVKELVQGWHSKSVKLRLTFLLGLRPGFFLRSCCGLTSWRDGCFSSPLSYPRQLYQWILSTVSWHSSVQRKPTLWCNGFHLSCCLEECSTCMSVLSFELLWRRVSWLLGLSRQNLLSGPKRFFASLAVK